MSDRLPPPRFRISRLGGRSRIKPQHRIVLGLVAMSAATLLITLLAPPPVQPPGAGGPESVAHSPSAPTPGTTPGARVDLPLPAMRTGTVDEDALGSRAEALASAVEECASAPRGFAPADGRLEVVVELASTGLAGARLDGLSGIGEEATACLVDAIGRAPWPSVDPPVAVRVPFYVVQPLAPEQP